MAYTPTTPEAGVQPIAAVSSTLRHNFNTIVEAYDPVFGTGSFAYLGGVGSTVVGSVVRYNPLTGVTVLAANTSNQGNPLAVAMAANVSTSTYGWYQVRGAAVIKKTAVAVAPNVKLYLSATAGRVWATASAGKNIWGAVSINAATAASATSTITALITYPIAEASVT